MNKHVHLVVPELFVQPPDSAEWGGLRAPALGKLFARANAEALPSTSLEDWLCNAFGAETGAIAPVTLKADGVSPGSAYWLRADPVHLMLRGSQLVVHPVATVQAAEAAQLCESLNRHFAGDGLHFVVPQPQRWYLRLECAPELNTHPMAQAAGKDMRGYLPQGPDALRWHRLLNEIQMLLFAHPVNQARETRGEWSINSVWLWGGGRAAATLLRPFERVCTDSPLAAAFADAAGISVTGIDERHRAADVTAALVVWDGLRSARQHGDLAEWRDSLQELERDWAGPLLAALRRGRITRVTLDALQERGSLRFTLTRSMAWRFWRRTRRLEDYADGAAGAR